MNQWVARMLIRRSQRARRLRQPVKRLAAPVLQVAADDLWGREVNQVPIVNLLGIGEVEVADSPPGGIVALVELADENDQGQQPFLVYVGVQQAFDLGEGQALEVLGDLAGHRNLDANEMVSLTVLAGARLEEAGEDDGDLGIGEIAESLLGRSGSRFQSNSCTGAWPVCGGPCCLRPSRCLVLLNVDQELLH